MSSRCESRSPGGRLWRKAESLIGTSGNRKHQTIAWAGARQAEIETRHGGDVTEPNEFNEFQRRRERQRRRRRILVTGLDVLTALALLAIAALVLKMTFY